MDRIVKKSLKKWLVMVVLGILATLAGFAVSQLELGLQSKKSTDHNNSSELGTSAPHE